MPGALISILRYPVILPSYRPFIILIWIGVLNEIISTLLIKQAHASFTNGNIYVLTEFLLIYYFFKGISSYYIRNRLYTYLGLITQIVWVTDNLILHCITELNCLYRIFYSFVIICLSIHHINYILITEKNKILVHPGFIICVVFTVFFSYKVFLEIFFLTIFTFPPLFYKHLFLIFLCVNLACNLFYTISIIWIPTKQKFSLPY